MRTRTEYYPDTISVDVPHITYINYKGVLTTRAPGTYPYFHYIDRTKRLKKMEVASDLAEVDTFSNWNSFEHYTRFSDIPVETKVPLACTNYNPSGGYDTVNSIPVYDLQRRWCTAFGYLNPFNNLGLLYDPKASGFIPELSDISTYKSRALAAMLPGIKAECSAVNSLIELKDFRKLHETLSRLSYVSRRLTDIFRHKTAFGGTWWGRTLRSIAGATGDVTLQKEFNIDPLIDDVLSIRKALSNVHRQVNNLLNGEGQRKRRHYVCDIPWQPIKEDVSAPAVVQKSGFYSAYPPVSSETTLNAAGYVSFRRVVSGTGSFHAEVEYTYYLLDYQKHNAQLLGLLDSLGVNLNPAIIWNALPWSFVVDWVINVSRWLDQFKLRGLEPVTVIHRFLYSTRRTRVITVFTKVNQGMTAFPAFGQQDLRSQTVEETAYKRVNATVTTNDIQSSGISLNEMYLSGALALARLR